MKKRILIATLVLAAGALGSGTAAAADGAYAVTQKWNLGAPSKWDYAAIDPVRHHLFIARGERVQVVDLANGREVGEIADTHGVHGVAFAQDLKLGFTSNGHDNSVTVFDLDALKVKQQVKVSGMNPDAILYEPSSHKLFTFNGKSNNVTVIDAVTLQIVATIPAGGRPEFPASDNAGKIFFNIEDKSEMNVIDVATNTVVSKWSLKGCEEPSGLALDVAHARLFSVCQNRIMVVTDARTGKRVADVAIGLHPDAAIFDADTSDIFSSNGDGGGTLTVIHQDDADHYTVKQNLVTAQSAKTMAMDKETKAIYLPTVIDKAFVVLTASRK